jgi:hypothetical protein
MNLNEMWNEMEKCRNYDLIEHLRTYLNQNRMHDGVIILILACMIEELVLERVMYKIV